MTWQTVALTGADLTPIKTAITNLKTSLDAILNLAKANALIAKALAGPGSPAYMALVAACDALIAELEALKSGGVSGILCHPYAQGVYPAYDPSTGLLKLSAFENLAYLHRAFDDPADLARPQGTGDYGALVFVVSVAEGASFGAALGDLGAFFNFKKLTDLKLKIEAILAREPGKPVFGETGEIDFFGITQAQLFPELSLALNEAIGAIQGIKQTAKNAGDALDALIAFIDEQQAELSSLASIWQAAIDKLALTLNNNGIWYRYWPPAPNGITAIRADLIDAVQMPPQWQTSKFGAVFGLFGGAPLAQIGTVLGI
ncbi:MAG: hypothetical protein A2557_00885 [Candidatus Lambdaproteobacteria bacterium RIFOXYD2_FULL_56_26]|uniref:Uncharacterized protein n=1 Tax=Candidatus Lambdaproteobacteria bacterium RIFOXYD2_FULL_56_26 TaxID=1817773 RepID=A0A1F6GMP0_9PROT|nr:MAG: hypothetical protein A2557_00885 [Candidatus Lambdaproteobacteria bacterium RIFOXYD2_FULL_56_26]